MRALLSFFLAVALLIHPGSSQAQNSARRGSAAGYSTRDATVLSMMGWGVGLGVGIGLLCGLIHTKTPDSDGNAHGHTHQ